jgi:hypothetical protein
MYPTSDLSRKLKLIASLVASGHIRAFTKYTFILNSFLLKRQKQNSLRRALQPSTVSSSRSSQVPTYSFVITRKGETPRPTQQTLIPFQRHPQTPTHQTCPRCILCSKAYKSMIPIEVNCFCHQHQQAFDSLKNSLACKVVLAYRDFSVPFKIYTNTSKYRIRSVITQKDKPLAFYSRKLTDPQI